MSCNSLESFFKITESSSVIITAVYVFHTLSCLTQPQEEKHWYFYSFGSSPCSPLFFFSLPHPLCVCAWLQEWSQECTAATNHYHSIKSGLSSNSLPRVVDCVENPTGYFDTFAFTLPDLTSVPISISRFCSRLLPVPTMKQLTVSILGLHSEFTFQPTQTRT